MKKLSPRYRMEKILEIMDEYEVFNDTNICNTKNEWFIEPDPIYLSHQIILWRITVLISIITE